MEYIRIQPNAGKYGKNADQNNSEYRHFLHSVNSHHDSKRIILDNVEFFEESLMI